MHTLGGLGGTTVGGCSSWLPKSEPLKLCFCCNHLASLFCCFIKCNLAKLLRKVILSGTMCGQLRKKYCLHHGKCNTDMLRSLLITWVLRHGGVGWLGGVCRCSMRPSMLRRFVTSLSRSLQQVLIIHAILDGHWVHKCQRSTSWGGSDCPSGQSKQNNCVGGEIKLRIKNKVKDRSTPPGYIFENVYFNVFFS